MDKALYESILDAANNKKPASVVSENNKAPVPPTESGEKGEPTEQLSLAEQLLKVVSA